MKRIFNCSKWIIISLSIIASYNNINAQSNDILMKYGNLNLTENVEDVIQSELNLKDYSFAGNYYCIVQFNDIPQRFEKEQMEAMGLRFLDYIPKSSSKHNTNNYESA